MLAADDQRQRARAARRHARFPEQAAARPGTVLARPQLTPAAELDDDQERRGRLLLLGEAAVLAHRLALPLAAELDEYRHSARRALGMERASRGVNAEAALRL